MTAQVKVLVNNFKAVRGSLTGPSLMNAAMNGGRVIQSNARNYAPVDTGNLRASIQVEPDEVKPNIAWVNIGTDVIYAAIQEFGGTIKPKVAKMLSWVDKDGKRIFARAVQIKAQPYLRPAVDNHMPRIKWVITRTLNIIAEKATK
jgi:phage gpG-like protein